MTTRVDDTTKRPTHHISLSDGTATLGLILCDRRGKPDPKGIRQSGMPRTTMRVGSGSPTYDDMEPPYTPITQQDWSGGRGAAVYEKDQTRFYDSYRCDTLRGEVILGPKHTVTTGYYSNTGPSWGTGSFTLTGVQFAASDITPSANITVRKIRVKLAAGTKSTIVDYKARVSIHSDNSGEPDAAIVTSDYVTIKGTQTTLIDVDFPIPATALTASTKYWVKVDHDAATTLKVGYGSETGISVLRLVSSTWTQLYSNASINFTLYTNARGDMRFFDYKGQLYFVTNPDDGTSPTVWMNGYRGVAESNSADKTLLKSGLTLSENELVGCIAKITEGPGSTEEQNCRRILSNTAGGDITCEPRWNVAHTTSTEFIILGCDTWQQVSTAGLTGPVTDVCVVDDVVYFAQGEDVTIRRFNAYRNSTTWTNRFDNDGSNKATYMRYVRTDTGAKKVWRALSTASTVSVASKQSWGSDLSFGSAITCGSTDTRITGLAAYGAPEIPYVFKEDSFGSVNNSIYAEIPIGEMKAVASDTNGRAWCRHDVYLYFSLLDGLERFYNGHLDDIGPNRDEGLPEERQGAIYKLISYPGRIYAAIDGLDTGFSSILVYNGIGWHEIYRAPLGMRIRSMQVQVMPGDDVDRMWIGQEEEAVWVPIALNPLKQNGYEYETGGQVVSSWMYGGMQDVIKFWKSAKLFCENLVTSKQTVTFEYQTDTDEDSDDWNSVGTFDASPVEELDMSASNNVTGRRWRYRLTLNTDDATITPRIKAIVTDAVTRVPTKSNWSLTFLAEDAYIDLQGIRQPVTAESILTQLETWADSEQTPAPLTMRSVIGAFDNKLVFIDPASVQPIGVSMEPSRDNKIVGSIAVYEA